MFSILLRKKVRLAVPFSFLKDGNFTTSIAVCAPKSSRMIVPSTKDMVENNKTMMIDNYFRRIDYHDSRTPSLDTLIGIHRAHTRAIPFENLNPLLGIPVSLNIESIYDKIVGSGRGGYCFEQNLLFNHVITQLGFETTGLAARVMWNVPEGVIPPRGHMLLLVRIKGSAYVADTGFGSLTLPEPLALTMDIAQNTSHEPFRFLRAENEYILQAQVKDEWRSLYRFNLTEQLLPDYEAANYFVSTHPTSYFTQNLAAARIDRGKRFALRNQDFTVHETGGESTTRRIDSVSEIRLTLENVFQISLPQSEKLDEVLLKILSR